MDLDRPSPPSQPPVCHHRDSKPSIDFSPVCLVNNLLPAISIVTNLTNINPLSRSRIEDERSMVGKSNERTFRMTKSWTSRRKGSNVAFRNLTAFGDDAPREIIIVAWNRGETDNKFTSRVYVFFFVNVSSERETYARIVR